MKSIVILIIFLCFTPNAFATFGVDVLATMKQYYVLLKQLKELKQQVSQADQIIRQGKKQISDAEGHYGFGLLLDDDSEFQMRKWGPGTWHEALVALSGGNQERYQSLLKTYQKDHPYLSERQYSRGASHSLVRSYRNRVQSNRAASVASDYEYEQIKKHLDHVHQLTKKIEDTENTKAAMDLNSRLIAELSYISVEELRMQTLVNHQMVAKTSDEIDERTRAAIFNQLPKEK